MAAQTILPLLHSDDFDSQLQSPPVSSPLGENTDALINQENLVTKRTDSSASGGSKLIQEAVAQTSIKPLGLSKRDVMPHYADIDETNVLSPLTQPNTPDERSQGKAGEPTPGNIVTGMLPGPTKDVVPTGLMNAASETSSPTLILGGFSILVMPMPKGGNIQQFMQTAPSFMTMLPTGR